MRFFPHRIAAFSISLVNDKTETASPALNSLFMNTIVDITIYKETTLGVSLGDFKLMFNTTNQKYKLSPFFIITEAVIALWEK